MYYIEIFFLKYEFIAASSTPTTNVIIFCRLINIYYNNNNNIAFLIFFLGSFNVCANFNPNSLLREENICVASKIVYQPTYNLIVNDLKHNHVLLV